MPRTLVTLGTIAALAGAPAGRADDGAARGGLWDRALESLDLKAAPAGAAPDFVRGTRPDPGGLGYMRQAVPHPVSPVRVKSAAEVDAAKARLDAARAAQLGPAKPLELPRPKPVRSAPAAR